MFSVIKKTLILIFTFFSNNIFQTNFLKCISMNNQECKLININANELVFYPYSIKVNKCSGNCNNIDNTYAKFCIPDVI